jgi:DNA-binding MurR/RpiR family transcriptional regulator
MPVSHLPPETLDQLTDFLRAEFSSMSPQFQLAARYLLDHTRNIPILSMRKIAAEAQVQPATLVRFAQHLGYAGWQDLRQLFVEAVHGTSHPYAQRAREILGAERTAHLRTEMLAAQLNNLENTSARNAETLPVAASLLARATNVYIAGFRASYPIAFGFHYVYRLFRSTAFLIRGEAGTLELELRVLGPKDAVFLTSFAPYSQEILQVAHAARSAGCTVIALTDSTVSPIALEADCTLIFSADSPSFFPSTAAATALTEALLEQLLAKKGKAAIKAIEKAEGQLHHSGAYAGRQT